MIWCVFFSLLEEVVDILKEPIAEKRDDPQFDDLQYIFIDDPVSSMDENHLIELAVNLASLIRSSRFKNGDGLRFIISTHNPLFQNVLCTELNRATRYFLGQLGDGSFRLEEKEGAANKSFSYHHFLMQTLKDAITSGQVQKYHFNMLRNLYEKVANFLGYENWTKLLATVPDERADYFKKVIQHFSHRELSYEEVAEPTQNQKDDIEILLRNLTENYGFSNQEVNNGPTN